MNFPNTIELGSKGTKLTSVAPILYSTAYSDVVAFVWKGEDLLELQAMYAAMKVAQASDPTLLGVTLQEPLAGQPGKVAVFAKQGPATLQQAIEHAVRQIKADQDAKAAAKGDPVPSIVAGLVQQIPNSRNSEVSEASETL